MASWSRLQTQDSFSWLLCMHVHKKPQGYSKYHLPYNVQPRYTIGQSSNIDHLDVTSPLLNFYHQPKMRKISHGSFGLVSPWQYVNASLPKGNM
jgi:hypothetical protein